MASNKHTCRDRLWRWICGPCSRRPSSACGHLPFLSPPSKPVMLSFTIASFHFLFFPSCVPSLLHSYSFFLHATTLPMNATACMRTDIFFTDGIRLVHPCAHATHWKTPCARAPPKINRTPCPNEVQFTT